MVSVLDEIKSGFPKFDSDTCKGLLDLKSLPRTSGVYGSRLKSRTKEIPCFALLLSRVILHSPAPPSRRPDLVIDHIPQCSKTMSCGLILPRRPLVLLKAIILIEYWYA